MTFDVRQMTITVGAPESIEGEEGRHVLARFYCALLGWVVIDEGWLRIAAREGSPLQLALDGDGWSDARPPRWNDPEHPIQLHLDVEVADVERTGRAIETRGGTLLNAGDAHRVYADPAGHPFCIVPGDGAGSDHGVLRRLVFDCFSPRSLASFYEGMLRLEARRVVDTPEHVTVALPDDRYPDLGFQHAIFVACRWPDDAYPAQLHVDWRFDSGPEAAVDRATRLGAIRLPKLADTTIMGDPAGHPFCL